MININNDQCQDQKDSDHSAERRAWQKRQDSVPQIQQKQNSKRTDKCNDLALCQRRHKHPDCQIHTSQQEEYRNGAVIYQKICRSLQFDQKREQAEDHIRNCQYCHHGEIFAKHYFCQTYRRCQKQLICFCFPLFRKTPHRQKRDPDQKYDQGA